MIKYIIMVTFGALSYGMLASFAKIAYAQGYNAAEITFVQALFGAILLWIAVGIRSYKKGNFQLQESLKLVAAGTSIGLSAYVYYLSVSYIPASLAIVLLMQVTWISILAEWLFFRKKPSLSAIITTLFIIVGTLMAGNLLAIKTFHFSTIGIMLGLLSAVIYSLYVIFTSKLGIETPIFEKSALMMSGSAIIIFLINFKSITSSTHLDSGLIAWGLFMAVFGTVIPPICFSVGMPKIGAGLSAILITLELPVAVFCAHLILNEKITFVQILGIIIMLSAITYLNLTNHKNNNSIAKINDQQIS